MENYATGAAGASGISASSTVSLSATTAQKLVLGVLHYHWRMLVGVVVKRLAVIECSYGFGFDSKENM